MFLCAVLLSLVQPLSVAVDDDIHRWGAAAQAPPTTLEPGWIDDSPAAISPDQARTLLEQATALTALDTAALETDATGEIEALARGLQHDPRLIFDYVHNMIDYVPTFGSVNGATATLYAGRGNDCDQTSLFIALMRVAGYDARYVTGDVTYSPERIGNWVGADASQAHNVLLNGGVPITGTVGGWQVFRVWAQARIGGTWYTFDPAMKEYTETVGLGNLDAVLGYNRAAFLGRARQGATVDADSARDLNEANIRADLEMYSTNLVNTIRTSLPNSSFDEVTGGRRIVWSETGGYSTSLPFAETIAHQSARLSTLTAGFRHSLTVSCTDGPCAGQSASFATHEIAGRRLTVFYAGTASVLSLDGMPVITYTGTTSGTQFTVEIAVDHPLTVPGQTGSFELTSGRGSYVIAHDWNGVSPQLVARRNALRTEVVFGGHPAASEAVLGEGLNVLGQTWMYQVATYGELVDRLNRTRTMTHHRVGIVGQDEGFYIDVPLAYSSVASVDNVSDVWLTGRVRTMMASAFEHGVLKQLQDQTGWDSVSAIRMLQFSNSQGVATFLARAANWDTIRDGLVGYSADDLAWFDALIAAEYELLLPQNGDQAIDDWSGVGYIQHKQTAHNASMGMIISGGYSGGYTSVPVTFDATLPLTSTPGVWPQNLYVPQSRDPVDMLTGAFVIARTDLSIGASDVPLSLRFSRSYNSHSRHTSGPLGYGWVHNHQMSAAVGSSGEAGLGAGGAVNAASMIAYTRVALDLLADESDVTEWTTAAIATKWAMDQLLDNTVTVSQGSDTFSFVRLADGTYNPAPGRADTLTVDAGGYHLTEPFGDHYDFDPTGRIVAWSDPNSNAIGFVYDGEGRLRSVTNTLGYELTLGYTDDKLTSVTDGGRSVSFSYTGDLLSEVTDPTGAVWRYAYDGDNLMT
ncbi:MAG: hypothetical protein GX620_07860, partial [Chloroflexi bacterium]|nr:hypothetical protein [Chloroflexota bacterium]